jgi:hypothetical protein
MDNHGGLIAEDAAELIVHDGGMCFGEFWKMFLHAWASLLK